MKAKRPKSPTRRATRTVVKTQQTHRGDWRNPPDVYVVYCDEPPIGVFASREAAQSSGLGGLKRSGFKIAKYTLLALEPDDSPAARAILKTFRELHADARRLLGSEAAARKFFLRPHPVLNGYSPFDFVLEEKNGAKRVRELLRRRQVGSARQRNPRQTTVLTQLHRDA
jgi:uncharacterized protein (DUF2384 family)